MVNRTRNILITLFFLLFFIWIGARLYSYFLDASYPQITVSGLSDNGFYSGDLQFLVKGKDDYKVADISIWLDDNSIVNKFKINKKEFEYQLPVPGKSLPNGRHKLKIQITDGSYKKNTTVQEYTFVIDNTPLQAAFVRPATEFKVFQGATLHIQFQSNKEIKEAKINIFAKTYECTPESQSSLIYECFIPVPCEEIPNEYPLTIEVLDKTGNYITLNSKLQVMPYPFKKQILSVSREQIKMEEEVSNKQQLLETELDDLYKKSPKQKLWQGGEFYIPIDMSRISCGFGTKRITQEKGCYMHKAIDLAGVPKTVVWAPQDGIVVVKNRYASSGNTIVIDHGLGIFTLLFHLDNFANINVGDKVKRGNPIGTMGKTGYATGYHLHWEMRINNIPVDPMQWTKYDF